MRDEANDGYRLVTVQTERLLLRPDGLQEGAARVGSTASRTDSTPRQEIREIDRPLEAGSFRVLVVGCVWSRRPDLNG